MIARVPLPAPRRTAAVAALAAIAFSHAARAAAQISTPMAGALGIPLDRMASGTTWIPDAVVLPTRMFSAAGWNLMFHGFVFAQYDRQDGPRGADQLGSLNWGMLMASRPLGGGRFELRTMLSLDPLTVTPRGYPLLLQTGERWRGEPIRDRQHPHDFWMELGVLYERAVAPDLGVSLYAAPSGEPALGPVAFMHRPSAMDNPLAPISHHWQDATHISFGVLTVGLFTKRWKLEGSAFNAREPDESRWDFDALRLGSYAGRLTFNPSASLSLTAGYGHLRSPDALQPLVSIHRFSASALHGAQLGADGQWASAIVYGVNVRSPGSEHSSAALIETEVILDRRNTVFARAEVAQKTAQELVVPSGTGGFAPARQFDVASASLGYIREIASARGATLGVGASGTLSLVPGSLEPYYGSRNPLGGLVFLRLRAERVRAAEQEHGLRHERAINTDSAFAAVQERGKAVMGVDQYTSQHIFEDLPDGGRIVLVRNPADTAGTRVIREHLRTIVEAFARGEFALPGQVHSRVLPGTRVMSARRDAIRYIFEDRPGGGAVRIATSDAEASKAVHEFLEFQRSDHRAPGREPR